MKRSILISVAIAILLFLEATTETKDLPQSGDIPQVSVSPTSVKTGETVTVTVTNGPGAPTDYVGVFTPGSPAKYCIDLLYLNGRKKAPSSGLKSATVSFATSTLAGTYEFRLYANNTWNLLARSPVVTVNGPTIELVGDPVPVSDTPRYCAFPDMVRLANGDLMVVYYSAPQHVSGASTIQGRVSKDDGKTWGAPFTVVPSINSNGSGVRDPHLIQLADGTLLLNYFAGIRPEVCFSHLIRSTDNGRTWSQPQPLDLGVPCKWVATCGKILALKNGDLLLPLYWEQTDGVSPAGTLRSRDGGKTWGNLAIVQKDSKGEGEMEMACLPDGSLVAMIRTGFYATSKDEGWTWSQPEEPLGAGGGLGLAAPGLLVDGPLLLLNYRGGSASDGCSVALSLDGGRTWPVSKGFCPAAGINTAYGTIIKTKPGSPAPYFTIFYRSPDDDPVFTTRIVGRYFKVIMP